METNIKEMLENKDYNLLIETSIEEFRINSFVEEWKRNISDFLGEEDITIKSLVIGKIGELPDRIYVGANTNKVLIFDTSGSYIESIELAEGDKVQKLLIVDVTNHSGNELLIQTGDETILFYYTNYKNDYEEDPSVKIYYATTSITAFFAIKLADDFTPIFIGDSNGNVLKNTYRGLKFLKEPQNIITESEKLVGETISAISGSAKLLNENFGLLIGYRNGLLLLMNSEFEVVSKFDIDREIENIYMIEKNRTIVINTDDNYIYHFLIIDNVLVNNWTYHYNSTISSILPDLQEESEIEFYVLSEDNGTISCFDRNGRFILMGDPSFDATTGVFFEQKLFLASREGDISQFKIIDQEKSVELQRLIHDSYIGLCQSQEGNDFFDFFKSEFDSDEHIDYFKYFLTNYILNKPDKEVIEKIIALFEQKKYNTDTVDGLIRKITSNSQLKKVLLEKFENTVVAIDIINYDKNIDEERNETCLLDRATSFLKKDNLKYIEKMCKLRVRKLDKLWMNSIVEDDHVVGIKYYHDPLKNGDTQILIATQKGTVLLLNRLSGQVIWSFKLAANDGTITNIDVADICHDSDLEIVLGLENSQNSIIILSTNKDRFNSENNEVQLQWQTGHEASNSFRLFLTRCNVSGMEYDAVHNVQCFDFDKDGVEDLIISSENGDFDIFCFDTNNRSRLNPRTKRIGSKEEDILVFELIRDENQQIVFYTGSASGNINKHNYNGNDFTITEKSFTERDAKITDIIYAEIENEKVVLFSSEDNYIYCLTNDLQYKWAYRTGGDVKSIGTTRFNNQDLVFAISDDGYLYALDASGNKKWRYLFMAKDGNASPLDKFLVQNDEFIVADSDGNIYLLHLKDTVEIINKMDNDLAGSDINLLNLLQSPEHYVRIFAIRKLLSTEQNNETLKKVIPFLNEGSEPVEIVRCEAIKILTRYLIKKETFGVEYSEALIKTLHDFSPDVQTEGLKSFLTLIHKHQTNKINIADHLIEITKDDNIWLKEYLAGALNKVEANNDELHLAKWKALASLIRLNIDEEWILNEAANSIGNFLSNVSNNDSIISYIHELFEYEFEDETYERIRNKIHSSKIALLFDLYYQIIFGVSKTIKASFNNFQKECDDNDLKDFKLLVDKIKSFINVIDEIRIDDIINDKLLKIFADSINCVSFTFSSVIDKLNEYTRENNISEKIVILKFTSDSIDYMIKEKSLLNIIDKRLFELSVEDHLVNLILKRSRWHMENVDLDIEMENREIIINDNGIADINFNVTNKGYNKIDEIEINVKIDNKSKFDIIENIGEIGELIKSQSKIVFFKIKPKVLGILDLNFEITYKGCEEPLIEEKRILIKEAIHKEWEVIPNPYSAGIPIENDDIFVGRETLIQEAIIALKKDPVFVMGHRRMGKTSLIKYIQRHYLSTEEYIAVFVSAEKTVYSTMNDFLFSFCRPIARELQECQIISDDKAEKYLDKIRENGLIDFGVFFDDILYKIKKQNKTLVLIIDEYPVIHEAVVNNKVDSQFVSNLRGYMQNNSKEFKMIYSGASSLKYLKGLYAGNLMGVGKSIEVSFLEEIDVKNLISKPLNNQMQLEDSAFQYLMELTNGQPFFVQVCLSYLVDKLNKEKKSSMVFKDAIEDGVSYFLDQAPHLQDDWNSRVYSKDLHWTENEEKIARVYKQLIITAITDKWRKSKSGLSKDEVLSLLESALQEFHKLNLAIFDEMISILVGPDDMLKLVNNMYFIKVGLFREWVISKKNFSFTQTLLEIKENFNNSQS